MTQKLGTVLIVDDEAIIRQMLKIELEPSYTVFIAEDAGAAFEILANNRVDLVISDINMPGIKGFELVRTIREQYPATKTALITAYNVNDYVRMARDNDVSNIISKSTPFNFDEFNSVVKNLVTEHIFGLENYMLGDFQMLSEYTIYTSADIPRVEEDIVNVISGFCRPEPFINLLLEELITNAVYHAPVDDAGREKYLKHSDVMLEESEAVKVYLGRDAEKYGVSVLDTSGKLTKNQVLYRIDRHINGEGLLDESGRGLHMTRIYSDRFVVNIKKNVATEAIFINYIDKKYKGFKPLYINEI